MLDQSKATFVQSAATAFFSVPLGPAEELPARMLVAEAEQTEAVLGPNVPCENLRDFLEEVRQSAHEAIDMIVDKVVSPWPSPRSQASGSE